MKKLFILIIIIGLVSLIFIWNKHSKPDNQADFSGERENIFLVIDGLCFKVAKTRSATVAEFLRELNIKTNSADFLQPAADSLLFSNSKIIIERAKNITLIADGKNIKNKAYGRNVISALWENNIKLGEDDFTKPATNQPLQDGDKIEVVRVIVREEIVKKDIPFKTKENEDSKLSWRVKKVTQKGEKGVIEMIYKVVSHNGKEISRKIISQKQIKDPVVEIVTQGTHMKLGKAKAGQATWYAFKGGLFAASTTLPRGAFAKVTNVENGKSVVVQINDYGPFGKDRIIDLDKVAFEKIAPLGAGVVGVKVEQILN